MDHSKQAIEILMGYGLTSSQAKVYIFLGTFESATAKTLYQTSSIARQDAYQILTSLQELGLVEKILGTPSKFRAVPFKDALAVLQQLRSCKNAALDDRATASYDQMINLNRLNKDSFEPYFEVGRVRRADPRVLRAIEKTNNKLRLLGCHLSWHITFSTSESKLSAKKRGVKIVALLSAESKDVPAFFKESVSEIRIDRSLHCANCMIFDDNEVAIWEEHSSSENSVDNSLPIKTLWSNHSGLILLLTDYFESKWNSASILR